MARKRKSEGAEVREVLKAIIEAQAEFGFPRGYLPSLAIWRAVPKEVQAAKRLIAAGWDAERIREAIRRFRTKGWPSGLQQAIEKRGGVLLPSMLCYHVLELERALAEAREVEAKLREEAW